jgi:hypothetical protein
MAVFNKNSLTQVSGFDNPIIAGELVWDQQTFWNFNLKSADNITPLNLTGATIDAQIVRRNVTNIQDTRNGLTFDIGNYTPTPPSIPLTITNRDNLTGAFTLVIDSAAWGLMDNDPGLDINAQNCVGYSGRVKIGFPAVGITVPADDAIIFLMFLVRSDGIVVE